MIELKQSKEHEISKFSEMERLNGTSDFIIPYTIEKHCTEMHKPNIVYLSIYSKSILVGFIILAVEDESENVEFRRIVVESKNKGIGQVAVSEMERYCKDLLKRNRIWLDVFDDNKRGQHIYNKLGYKQFKTGEYNGKPLLYFAKKL